MNYFLKQIYVGVLLSAISHDAVSQVQSAPRSPEGSAIPVTADNFNCAESDMYWGTVVGTVVKDGGFGKFVHHRELYPIDGPIVRPNRDTLYSMSVFDFDAGPVTITLPDAGKRFMSLQVLDGDQYTHEVIYGAGAYTFTREQMGTRYGSLGVRILVDPNDPKDVEEVHKLQNAIKVEQPDGTGKFEPPNWDPVSQKKVRDALLVLGSSLPDTKRMFGLPSEVDPGPAPDWNRHGIRRQSRERRPLSQHHAAPKQRRHDRQIERQRRAGRWLLVRHRLQRQGLPAEEPIRCVFAQ